uniref:Regulator of nonsense transcripts 2 n=1 Tax=Timema shepardi TaxID=629360 RepID=A0A7R9AVR8_TIMSH|nr:unnamed protein product [Timema shepardi]
MLTVMIAKLQERSPLKQKECFWKPLQMDPVVSSERTVPERRAKSWRREHEERCNRRLTQKKPSHTPGDATVEDGTNTSGCSSVDEFMFKGEHPSNKNDVKPPNSETSTKVIQPEETSARSKAHKLLPQENMPCVCNGKMTISSGSLKCTVCSDSITDLEEKVKDLGSKKMSSNSDLTDKVDTLIDLISGIANGPIDQNSFILSDAIPSTYDRGKEVKVKPNNGLKTLAELAQDSIFGVTCHKSNITPPDIVGYVDLHAADVSDDKMETAILDTNKDSYFPENQSSKLQINSEQEKTLSVSTESDNTTNHTSLPENITNELTQEELGALADSEDRKYLLQYIVEAEERLASTTKLREINQTVAASRPDESYFTKLDSSLKKNTAFVRKLKMFTASQLDSLLKDMSTLNLTKYISEAAAALVEAKLKMNDISCVIKLCNALHRDYADFSTHLLDNWQKVLSIKKDDKSFIQSKLRVDLRFYAEVINSGILTHKEGLPLLGSVLTVLINMDKEEHNNINIILTFCRYCGEDYAGKKIRQLAERYLMTVPRSTLLSKEKQRNVRTLLKDYYTSLCKHLLKEHRELQAFERQNKKILQTKGELSGERRERGTALQVSLQRLLTGTQGFSEVLDEDFPLLPQDDAVNIETLDSKVGNSESEDGLLSSNMWEDDETQNFYEYLPNMKDFLPSLTVQTNDLEAQVSEEALEADHLEELADDCMVIKEEEEEPLPPDPEEVEEPESQASSSNKILLESFFTSLPQCVNREMIDNAAVDFVMTLNTKYNRKKLVKMLFSVPRTRLDLLPFYARLVAILHPVMPDIATELGQFLKQDFKFHIRKKDQINIESKIKVVRFVGELVKFRMYSKIEALYCLKLLLHDFTHHHIEMCCNLLESCGRFLFRHPDSHQRTKAYLEQMMRKKSVTALDSRYVTMIENAYYHVNPPELAPYVKKERPPMHEFIRKILYQDLTKPNTDKVLRLMRKLEWDNEELASYAVKCLTFAFNVKYYNIRCLANLVAGLVTYQECVGTQVVDGVMEDIRLGMEINLAKHNQRRVAMVKYLGELYNYRMVESGDVFKVLYSLITFGVSMSHDVPSDLDPPENLFRIRLVCILLETCGQYFSTGISKKKLDYFLLFFQNYYWFKFSDPYWVTENTFPVGMTHMFRDTLLNLRPNLLMYANFEDAQKGIEDLKNEFAKTVLKQFQSVLNSPSEHEEPSAGGLELDTIIETAAEQEEQLDGDESKEDEESEPVGGIENKGKDESMSLQSRDSEFDIGKDDEDVKDEDEYKNDIGTLNFEEDEDDERDIDDNEDRDTVSEFDDASPFTSQSQSDEVNMLGALPPGPSRVECPEDDEFLNAFEQMVSSNIQDRMRETVKPQQLDISVPLHIKNSAKKTYEQLQEPKPEQKSMINFVLMVRKGHKQQYKSLAVPVTSELALNLRDREEAERAEKQRVKRLTLDINERLEEEDYQEMLAQGQRPVVMNLNRERRHKYQHPKGAPDADLIFGSKRASLVYCESSALDHAATEMGSTLHLKHILLINVLNLHWTLIGGRIIQGKRLDCRDVPVPVPHPVAVPVSRPYPVHVPHPVAVPVERPYPVPVERPVAYPVPQAVPYPVAQPVAVPVSRPYPVVISKPVAVPVAQPVVINKPVAVSVGGGYGLGSGLSSYGGGYGLGSGISSYGGGYGLGSGISSLGGGYGLGSGLSSYGGGYGLGSGISSLSGSSGLSSYGSYGGSGHGW